MARKYVDCREMPSEKNCTVAISADSEKELMDIAVQHAVAVHGHKDTPEFRQILKQAIKEARVLSEPPCLAIGQSSGRSSLQVPAADDWLNLCFQQRGYFSTSRRNFYGSL